MSDHLPQTPTAEEWRAVTRGAVQSVGGGIAMIGVRSLGLLLRAVFGGPAYGLFVIAYNLIELLTYFLLGGFVDGIVLFAARYLPGKPQAIPAAPEEPTVLDDVVALTSPQHEPAEPVEDLAAAAQRPAEVVSLWSTETEREDKLYRALATCMGIPVLLGCFIALGIQWLAPWLHRTIWSEHDPLIVDLVRRLSWALPLLVLMQLPAEAIKAHLKWGWAVSIVQVLFPVISLVGAIIAELVFHRGILGLVDGVMAAFAVCVPLSLFAFARHFSLPRLIRAMLTARPDREVLSFALPQGMNMALNQGLVRVDTIVLSAFISANAVGVYALVSELTQLIRLAKMSLSGVYSPLAARLHAAGLRAALQNALHRMATMTALISIPLLLVVMTIYPSLVMDAEETWEWSPIFPWFLAVGPMMSCFFGLAGNTLLMVGRPRLLLMNSTISGTLNIVLNLILVPFSGLLGAAIATATSNFTISFLQIVELAKLEKLKFHVQLYARTLLAAAVPLGAVIWLGEPTGQHMLAFTGYPDVLWVRSLVATAAVALFFIVYALIPGPSALAVWRGHAPPVRT